MKRITAVFLSLLLLVGVIPVGAAQGQTETKIYKEFYVSVDGSDTEEGTKEAPFKTIERAQEEVRKYNQKMTGDIVVNLMPGRYELSERLEFKIPDSGNNGYDVIYRAIDPENLPTISGAEEVTGEWTKGDDGIWHIKAENLEFARELFVNETPAIRARSPKKIYGSKRYLSEEKRYHAAYNVEDYVDLGFYVDKSKLGLYENPEDIEFRWGQNWRSSLYHVDDIIQDPENENQVIAIIDRTIWDETYKSAAGSVEAHFSRGFIVENAYELLDEPGEFYFNKKTKMLSYIPREGEDMATATVLCPQIDELTFVTGENYYERVHNIRFENIRFAHATNLLYEESSFGSGQGEYGYQSMQFFRIGRANNLVDWAEYIDYDGCVFFGLTAMALHFRQGVHYSDVTGCVFSDLGATGFAAGQIFQSVMQEPVDPDGLADVAWGAAWKASYDYYPKTAYTFNALNTCRDNADLDYYSVGWHSEPWVVEEGTLPWLKLDLGDEFTLESFDFGFPNDATAQERSNFEVLLSNDWDFEEYKTLKTYTDPAELKESIKVGDGVAYRYIMLRKTKSEPFCLNAVWAWSSDRKPLGQMGAPSNCKINNNVFTRVAQQVLHGYSVWLNYTDSFEVMHNDISEVPYSAISTGWGWEWAKASTCKNNKISYNRIDRAMRQLDDGGGIYNLGNQFGTELKGNYITNIDNRGAGIYLDQGSTGLTLEDNICSNTTETVIVGMRNDDNTVKNQWAITGRYEYGAYTYAENYHTEPIQFYDPSSPPEEVIRIMVNAGLEEEYRWIAKRVPELKGLYLYGPDAAEPHKIKSVDGMGASTRATFDVATANAILEKGDFGYLPWQYDQECKQELLVAVNRIDSTANRSDDVAGGHIEEMYMLQDAVKKTIDSSKHLSYEEMIAMCEELETSAKAEMSFGGYPQAAIDRFKKEFAAIKAENPQSEEEKAIAAGKLEKVYTALYQSCYRAEVLSFVVSDGETRIYPGQKAITVTLPASIDRSTITPVITVTENTKIAVNVKLLDFTNDRLILPLYHNVLKDYDFWTVEIQEKQIDTKDATVSANAEDWTDGNINAENANVGGALTIAPWWQPTMYKNAFEGKISFWLNVPRADTTNGIGILFNAQGYDIEATGKAVQNSYYKAVLKGQDLILYRADSGVLTECASVKGIGYTYGRFVPLEISVTTENNMDHILITSNGSIIMNTLVANPIGEKGYFGILTQDIAVKIK